MSPPGWEKAFWSSPRSGWVSARRSRWMTIKCTTTSETFGLYWCELDSNRAQFTLAIISFASTFSRSRVARMSNHTGGSQDDLDTHWHQYAEPTRDNPGQRTRHDRIPPPLC